MRSAVVFLVVLFLISVAGIAWGIYEFQEARGMKTPETVALVKTYLARLAAERRARRPKPPTEKPVIEEKPPEPKPEEPPEEAKQPEKPVPEEAPVITPSEKTAITPSVETPVTPTRVELRRTPNPEKPEKPRVKPEARDLVDEGNKYYDRGIAHLQNTFKKDSTFDRENELAIEKFRQAMAKYLEAEKIDGESLWLRNRIRETNSNIVTCRKQARRK